MRTNTPQKPCASVLHSRTTLVSLVYETRLFKKMGVGCEHVYSDLKLYIGHPESKDCLCIALAQVIHHIVQTWTQVIFTRSKHRRNILVADDSKAMKKCQMPSSSG